MQLNQFKLNLRNSSSIAFGRRYGSHNSTNQLSNFPSCPNVNFNRTACKHKFKVLKLSQNEFYRLSENSRTENF